MITPSILIHEVIKTGISTECHGTKTKFIVSKANQNIKNVSFVKGADEGSKWGARKWETSFSGSRPSQGAEIRETSWKPGSWRESHVFGILLGKGYELYGQSCLR